MEIPAVSVDGNDVLAVYKTARRATARARSGEGPSFIEANTYRWRGHHMGDQGDTYGYRTQAEIEEWMGRCPINRFREYLLETLTVPAQKVEQIDAEVKQEIEEAVEYAKEAPYPDPSEVYQHVYA
jgi:pyruvate dehydrogenase E1 component alpha subunit